MKTQRSRLTDIVYSFKVISLSFVYILTRPRLYIFILLPFVLNLIGFFVFFGLVFNFIFDYFNNLTDLLEFDTQVEQIIDTVLDILGFLISLIVSGYFLNTIALIVQSPFNTYIVEMMLAQNGYKKQSSNNFFSGLLVELVRATKFELIKLLLIVMAFVITFVLNFIPLVGGILYLLINSIIIFLLNLLDLLDPTYNVKGMGVLSELKFTIGNLRNYFGLGLLAYIVWGIPFINFFLMPYLYLGGAMAFLKTLDGQKEK